MARNIEIKARIESVESLAERVAAIADEGPIEMLQDDTFFTWRAAAEPERLRLWEKSRTHPSII